MCTNEITIELLEGTERLLKVNVVPVHVLKMSFF